jgi:hypothetical protein
MVAKPRRRVQVPQKGDSEKDRAELEARKRRKAARVGEERAMTDQMRDDPDEVMRLEASKRKAAEREAAQETAQQNDDEEIVRDIEDRKRK